LRREKPFPLTKIELGFLDSPTRSLVAIPAPKAGETYEGWNFNSGNYLFTTDTK